MAKRIAIVEDEPALALLIGYNLEKSGYRTKNYASSEVFLNQLASNEFNLIIINVQLSDVHGLKLCEEIRNRGVSTPILFLTTSLNEENCSCVEEMTFVNKPFSIKALLNQIKIMLK